MPLALDLDSYARDCERFVSEMDREYYLHFAGHKEEFEIEEIYERHAGLFDREVGRGPAGARCAPTAETSTRRVRYLLELAVGGLLGRETKREEAELAEREAALELDVDGRAPAVPPERGHAGQRGGPGPRARRSRRPGWTRSSRS